MSGIILHSSIAGLYITTQCDDHTDHCYIWAMILSGKFESILSLTSHRTCANFVPITINRIIKQCKNQILLSYYYELISDDKDLGESLNCGPTSLIRILLR